MRNCLIVTLFCFWVLPLRADVSMDYRLYDLPLTVELVKNYNDWSQSDMTGYYRVYLVQSERPPVSHSMYIQWVCHCDAGRLALKGISEFNGMERFHLTEPTFRRAQATDMLEFEATNVYTRERMQVQLQLLGIGNYRIATKTMTSDIDERYQE
ncbi:hypothetical protein [Salinibius halmophilus]|uniref:hypothetical protein n=1 Tax=Salinibius halmophilus TaxID=1853216 RepID=UPI000E669E89|nr:hypothetical protein [Salinibius halmophilus]